MITRADLHRVLVDQAQDEGVPIHFDKSFVSLETLRGSPVMAQFSDGTSAEGDSRRHHAGVYGFWEKDRIARQTAQMRVTFDMALSNKRKYPVTEFKAFVESARRHIEITAGDPMIHRIVVQAVNGLREFLQVDESESLETFCLRRHTGVPALRWLRSELRRR